VRNVVTDPIVPVLLAITLPPNFRSLPAFGLGLQSSAQKHVANPKPKRSHQRISKERAMSPCGAQQ